MADNFTDGLPRVATQRDTELRWSCSPKNFRCGFCGHKFIVGDTYRFVFTNSHEGAGGNPLVCQSCDASNEELIERWRQKRIEFDSGKWWWFRRSCGE